MGLTTHFQGATESLSAAVETMLDRADQATILAIGDLMLDRFVSGRVERISPEAPIPVLAVERETAMPGGVGNVVANVRALGGRVALVAVVGQDLAGESLRALLGCAKDFGLVADPARPTAVKERFVAGGQQLLRADYEQSRPIEGVTEDRILAEIASRLPDAKAVILSDYGKGILTRRVLETTIKAAGKRKIPVIVDPKGSDYARYRGATVVTPNLKELAEAAGAAATSDDAVVAAARGVLAKAGIASMVATRGREGLTIVPAEAEPIHIRAEAREVFDVSGAGDTVVATLALALATGMALDTAAALANLAGGVVVGKVGTAPVTADELRHAADGGRHGDGKLLALPALVERVERWRRRGLSVGFTNGCFDLLHPGHLSLLRQARKAADRLIVGLNSDSSVRRLKGPGRPVSDETSRAAVLAAVSDVDAVAIFGEDTPIKLIEAVRPDALVKGADYSVEQIVGADFVQSYGGRVVRAALEAGHSTTATVAKIAAAEPVAAESVAAGRGNKAKKRSRSR